MRRLFILLSFLLSLVLNAVASQKIVVTEQSVHVPDKGAFCTAYQFSAGDKIIVNLTAKKEKNDNFELVIEEATKNGRVVRYSNDQTARIRNKELVIPTTAPYIFTISHSHSLLSNSDCSLKIERVPAADSLVGFNTADLYLLDVDTTWTEQTIDTVTGYTTVKELHNKVIKDTVYKPILNKTLKLGSLANMVTHFQGREVLVPFTIPYTENDKLPDGNITRTLQSWSYWVGVGQDAKKAYEAENSAATKVLGAVATYFLTDYAVLINGALTLLNDKNGADNIKFNLSRMVKKDSLVTIDEGNITSIASQISNPNLLKGNDYQISLYNDNYISSVDANVRILAKYEEVKNVKYSVSVQKPVTQKVTHRLMKVNVVKQKYDF